MGAFSVAIGEFAKRAGANAELVARKVGIDALTSIVRRSPVDTGRFRANWQVGIDAVGKRTDDVDKAGNATIAQGAGQIGQTALGDSIWISNSLPYASRLEYGYSKQAPLGMVRVTIAEFEHSIDAAVKGLA